MYSVDSELHNVNADVCAVFQHIDPEPPRLHGSYTMYVALVGGLFCVVGSIYYLVLGLPV